jgi:hypothetical protein
MMNQNVWGSEKELIALVENLTNQRDDARKMYDGALQVLNELKASQKIKQEVSDKITADNLFKYFKSGAKFIQEDFLNLEHTKLTFTPYAISEFCGGTINDITFEQMEEFIQNNEEDCTGAINMQFLVGKTIVEIDDECMNAVTIKCTDGSMFTLDCDDQHQHVGVLQVSKIDQTKVDFAESHAALNAFQNQAQLDAARMDITNLVKVLHEISFCAQNSFRIHLLAGNIWASLLVMQLPISTSGDSMSKQYPEPHEISDSMSKQYPEPHEINERHGQIFYRCRPCQSSENLHWYRGTSCSVCSKPECTVALDKEWAIMLKENES